MQLFENQYIRISKIENTILFLEWFAESDQLNGNEILYQTQIWQWVNTVKAHQATHILVDTRQHFFVIDLEMQDWFSREIDTLYNLSVKKFAFIMSQDFIAQLSIEQAMDTSKEKGREQIFETRYFPTVEEGKTWLLSTKGLSHQV